MDTQKRHRRLAWTAAMVTGVLAATVASPAALGQDAETLTIMTSQSGKDAEAYEEVLAAFTEKTGIQVNHEGLQEFETTIVARVEGGDPPDLAEFPQSGLMKDLDKINPMVDLSQVLDADQMASYPASLFTEAKAADGRLISHVGGLAVANSTIFYDPATWAQYGYTEPTTWQELLDLTSKMKEDGVPPWCVTIESGGATGWIVADWIMDMVLQQQGEEVYNQWLRGEVKNSDPRIKAAWEEVGKILNDPDAVYGGTDRMLSTSWDQQALPMFADPAQCGMTHFASFALSSMPSDVVADLDKNLGMFLFPKVNADATEATVGNSTFTGILVDSPAARELAKFIATPEAFEPWIGASPYALSYNNKVPLDWYGSQVQKDLAAAIGGGVPIVVENAVDSFPGAVAQATWSNLAQWVEDGGANIDERLADIDAAWEE